jgi:hypothetical protein
LHFADNGSKLYIVGASSDSVHRYDLSSAYDVATAAFSQSVSVAAEDTSPQSVWLSTDGTRLFVLGGAGDDVNEYALATAYNLTTATYTRSFSVASKDATPSGLAFKPDGTKMFVVGTTSDSVHEYTLAAAAANPLTLAGTYSNTGTALSTPQSSFAGGYTLTGAGTAANPVSLVLGGLDECDNRVWLAVNQSGTLNWTVTANSESGFDGGRLFLHAGPPSTHTAQAFNTATQAGYTAISDWRSGTQTQSGTFAVTNGQFLVLLLARDGDGGNGNNRIELAAHIA